MQHVTFDFLGQHRHGMAFHQYLRLRKSFFVDLLGWDIPHNDDVEMDQYDNPCAYYSLVLWRGDVVCGCRTMPTTASWGRHTYLLRDVRRGHIDQIPDEVVPFDFAMREVWECTRLVMSKTVASHSDRAACLSMVMEGVIEIASCNGGLELVSLTRVPLMRALRQLGFTVSQLGASYVSETDGREYAVLRMPAARSSHLIAAA
jgi:N-acyl-L-homoserine lactone synthetase